MLASQYEKTADRSLSLRNDRRSAFASNSEGGAKLIAGTTDSVHVNSGGSTEHASTLPSEF